ncbi:hypothetical protein EOM09_05910 [bacterium]|nr:hypothetical protein [bacterium]
MKNRKITIKIYILLSLIISFLFFGNTINSKMGIIDDHTYFASGVLSNPFTVWNNFINATEIKSFGNIERFRIIYDLINNIETLIFRTNAIYWYLTNIFVFAFFTFTIFYLTSKNIQKPWSFLSAIYIISKPYFAYIFTRLGTAEVWTILGISIYSLGFNSLYHKSKNKHKYKEWKEWLVMTIGSIICIGSKENFAFLGILFILMIFILKCRNKLSKISIIFSILLISINLFQITDIFISTQHQKIDFYKNSTNIKTRINETVSEVTTKEIAPYTAVAISSTIIITFFYLINKRNKKIKNNKETFLIPLISIPILYIIFLFNLYIYNGTFYTSHRYAFPSVITIQLTYLIVFNFLLNLQNIFNFKFSKTTTKIIFLIICFFLLKKIYLTYKTCKTISIANVNVTNEFQNNLKEIIEKIKEHPDNIIIFSSYNPYDFELLDSSKIYLRYY